MYVPPSYFFFRLERIQHTSTSCANFYISRRAPLPLE